MGQGAGTNPLRALSVVGVAVGVKGGYVGRFTDFLKEQGVSRRNPYVDVVARHAGTLGDTGDLIGAFARGDVGKLPAVAKGVIVDGLLGTLIGVPGELAAQYGEDAATAGNAYISQAVGGKPVDNPRAFHAQQSPQAQAASDTLGNAAIMAISLGVGGVGPATSGAQKLPAGAWALNVALNGPAALPLGRFGKGKPKAGAAVPEAGALKEALAEGKNKQFKELGDKILAIDKAGGAIQEAAPLLDEAGKPIKGLNVKPRGVGVTPFPPLPEAVRQANMVPEGLTLKEAVKAGKLRLDPTVQAAIDAEEAWLAQNRGLAALRDSGGGIQEALPGMKVKPQNVGAVGFPGELDEAARQARMIEAGQLTFPGMIRDRGKPIELAKEAIAQPPQQIPLGAAQAPVSPISPSVASSPTGKGATGILEGAPDLSLGNLNDRYNASPVPLPGEAVPPRVSANLNQLKRAAYGDKADFAFKAVLKRLGARVEPDGRITREGADITEQVHEFLRGRPGLPKKEADAALGALERQVKGLPAGGDIAAATATRAAGGARDLVPGALRGAAADNYAKPLSQYTDRLYHETDIGNALEFIDPATMGSPRPVWFSNTPDLATGQGNAKGVLLELAPEGIEGQVSRAKPTWQVSWDAGAAEFIAKDLNPSTLRDRVRSITVLPEVSGSPGERTRLRRLLNGLMAQGWQREELADGSVRLFRPLAQGGDIAAGGGGMGIVSPAMLASMRNPGVLSTAIGATGGALAGGMADPDGGADGYIGGALAGAGLGYGAGKLPAKAIGETLGIMHTEGKKAFGAAVKEGGFSLPSLALDWRDDKTKTVRGLAIDELSNRVRALVVGVPQAAINGTYRSLLNRRKAAGALVPYDDELEEMLRLSFGTGFDPAAYDWAREVGQGYMAGAGGEGVKALHPAASAAAGAAYSLAGPGALVPFAALPVGAVRGAARPYTTGAFQAANDLGHYAVRTTAYKREARALLERAHTVFAAQLRTLGVDPSALRADGLYSAADVDALAPGAGKVWKAVQDQIYGVPAIKAKGGAAKVEQTRGLAGEFVVKAFGDYASPGKATKWLDRIAPFSRYAVGQAKPLARLAAQHPVAALALAKWIAQDKRAADKEGRPGYQVGTLRVDTETPLIGRVVRAQLGGGDGEGRINPLNSAISVSGSNVGATDKFEDADTIYKWAEAIMETMGFQFNPLIQAGAYVVGGDYGTDRAPGAQSRTSGIEVALPGGEVQGLKGLLDQGREAMGNYPDNYDPIDLLAKEIIYEQEQKPASDPSLRYRREELLDPNSELMQEARRRFEGGGAARNAVSLVSPVTMQVNTNEKVAYRQSKADQEGVEKPTGAAQMYQDPKYPAGAVKGDKKVDPKLREFERTYSTMKRLAPKAYAAKRKAFIKEQGIKE